MGHHHRINSSRYGFAKGRQLYGIQTLLIARHLRYAQVRVGRRVAVSGKMLGCGHHAIGPCGTDIRRNKISYLLWVFTKRTRIDDGIRGI